jgi:hypothetical protein
MIHAANLPAVDGVSLDTCGGRGTLACLGLTRLQRTGAGDGAATVAAQGRSLAALGGILVGRHLHGGLLRQHG